MPPRWAVLTALVLLASPLRAKTPAPKHKASAAKRATNKKVPALTWEKLAERVLKEGVDRPFTSPAARNLGYDGDSVPAKAVRYEKSHTPDHQEHAIYVVSATDKSGLHPKEIIIDTIRIFMQNDTRYAEGYYIRFKPDGTLISALRTSGIPGRIVQTVVPVTDKFVRNRFAEEDKIFLKQMACRPFDK